MNKPEQSYNQHPRYEEWKNICPACNSDFTTHDSESAAEDTVILKCTACGHAFTLKEAFEAQLARPPRVTEALLDDLTHELLKLLTARGIVTSMDDGHMLLGEPDEDLDSDLNDALTDFFRERGCVIEEGR